MYHKIMAKYHEVMAKMACSAGSYFHHKKMLHYHNEMIEKKNQDKKCN